jgi:hypothetical protein
LVTNREAAALRDMAQRETLSSSLAEMQAKVKNALKFEDKVASVDEIDARDLLRAKK